MGDRSGNGAGKDNNRISGVSSSEHDVQLVVLHYLVGRWCLAGLEFKACHGRIASYILLQAIIFAPGEGGVKTRWKRAGEQMLVRLLEGPGRRCWQRHNNWRQDVRKAPIRVQITVGPNKRCVLRTQWLPKPSHLVQGPYADFESKQVTNGLLGASRHVDIQLLVSLGRAGSSRNTSVTDPVSKKWRSVRPSIMMPAHTITPLDGKWCLSVMLLGSKRVPRSLHIVTRRESLLRLNWDSSLNITLAHSPTLRC
ncbi:hypothetical protein TNCV_1565831 [Trichonephila clavipes]|nr:hypothetical protein TNCV_1565831 [Trichonephila clavipes]